MFAVASAENFRPLVSKRYLVACEHRLSFVPDVLDVQGHPAVLSQGLLGQVHVGVYLSDSAGDCGDGEGEFSVPNGLAQLRCGRLVSSCFAAVALSAAALSAAALSSAARSGVVDVGTDSVATTDDVADLVAPSLARSEKMASNKTAPVPMRILCRSNQFLRRHSRRRHRTNTWAGFFVHC